MLNKKISNGTIHKLPKDLQQNLIKDKKALIVWEDVTPLARNEFICWVESSKKLETRERRIKRTLEELRDGMRRPCCWPGCPHHRPSAKK